MRGRGVQVCSHAGASAGACLLAGGGGGGPGCQTECSTASAGKSLARVDSHRRPVLAGEGSS